MSEDKSTTKLVVSPMPEVYAEADTEAQLDAVRVYRLDELRAYARLGWQTAQREANRADAAEASDTESIRMFRSARDRSEREAALADELAEALRAIYNFHNAETMDEARRVMAKHTAARQMNKEARNG